MVRPVLLVGGAPRLAVDAVRFVSVRASGATACALAAHLRLAGITADVLLGTLAEPGVDAQRYDNRDELETALHLARGPSPGRGGDERSN